MLSVTRRGLRFLGSSVLAAAFAAVLTGCGGPRFNVTVSLSDEWVATGRVPSVEVDMVGAGAADTPALEGKDLREYFRAGDDLRAGSPRQTFTFSRSDVGPKTLSTSDGVWAAWDQRAAETLFILANWPRIDESLPGTSDPRRLMLPMDPAYWGTNEIEVVLFETGLRVMTIPQSTVPAQ
ncbi:MAG: hypothetical protein AAF297_01070 [Planctomycetota bacterium]